LNCFGEVLFEDIVTVFKIGNRPGNFEYPVVGAGGETEAVGDHLQEAIAGGIQFAVLSYEAGCHLGVAMDFCPFKTFPLEFAGCFDPFGDCFRAFTIGPVGQVAVFYCRDFDVDVNPVHEGAGDTGAVAMYITRRAGTGMGRVTEIAAGARVEGRDQHDPCRIGHG